MFQNNSVSKGLRKLSGGWGGGGGGDKCVLSSDSEKKHIAYRNTHYVDVVTQRNVTRSKRASVHHRHNGY